MRFTGRFFHVSFFVFILASCQGPAISPRTLQPGKSVEAGRSAPFNRQGRLIFTRHARCRMDCRHITEPEIREVLDSGTINYAKSEPDARPDPKYAVESYTEEHQHLRIIVAPSGDKLIIITCIELGVEWQCHCN
jgi:hypothetical protein